MTGVCQILTERERVFLNLLKAEEQHVCGCAAAAGLFIPPPVYDDVAPPRGAANFQHLRLV